MNVDFLHTENFRNLTTTDFEPCQGVNLIYGANAQGKTNLLESIWLFSGCRSFRSAKDKELIAFGKEKASLSLDFFGYDRKQNMEINISDTGRTFTLNGIKKQSSAAVVGEFPAVVFSPAHLTLIKNGPGERRKFLDIAISQLKPLYARSLLHYRKAIKQRNAILKSGNTLSNINELLDIWDEAAAKYGSEIISQRLSYINELTQSVKEIYDGISGKKETLNISYVQNKNLNDVNSGSLYEKLLLLLKNSRRTDLISFETSVGPHRDDINIKINDINIRHFGSQGQQRSAALAMKLGEAAIIKNRSGQHPVLLLDDVMSELDSSRQNYILNNISDCQVFITCCEGSAIDSMMVGKAFEMTDGVLLQK